MAEAGFFFLDLADWVQCFYCGGGIFAWASGDIPFKVHARFYPFCSYVIANLGKEDVAHISAKFPPPTAPDRPVQLTEEEAELLLNHPMCKVSSFTTQSLKILVSRLCNLKFFLKVFVTSTNKVGQRLCFSLFVNNFLTTVSVVEG